MRSLSSTVNSEGDGEEMRGNKTSLFWASVTNSLLKLGDMDESRTPGKIKLNRAFTFFQLRQGKKSK